jgi:hypothetical protein
MQTNFLKIINVISKGFIVFSALSLLSVSIMAIVNPQSVMDLVAVQLPNTDAFSSIRGVYGGVGLSIVISLCYLIFKDQTLAIGFLCMLWGFYALSRITTIYVEGKLGAFGNQWLQIELFLFSMSVVLFWANFRFFSKSNLHK